MSGETMHTLTIDTIRTNGGTQTRAEINQFTVDDYAFHMRAGAVFPPVVVFYDGEAYWLADGFHRLAAAKLAGKDKIAADIKQGSQRDAVLFSVGVNARHGLRRTNADKRRAVMLLLEDDEWRKWSDYKIAEKCSVSQPFVLKLRKTLTNNVISEKTYITRHGTTATMNTTKIGKPAPLPLPVRDVLRDADVAQPVLRAISEVAPAAQADIAEAVALYGIGEPETVRDLARVHKSQNAPGSNGTFDEIVRSGYVQPGDEEDAVHIADPNFMIKRALMKKSETHRVLASHQLINQSENNEWYTPKRYLDAVHAVMGAVDLDPASCEIANRTVRAAKIYTIDDNGYVQEWPGRVFLNPPYGHAEDKHESNQARWSRRLIEQYAAGITTEAIMLVNAVPGNKWFAPLWEFPICFPDHRIRFESAQGEAGQPTHSNAFVYLGVRRDKFAQVFEQFGVVAVKYGR